jgi:hypothetical protein
MSIVNLANNNISGRFPRSWTFLPWLSQVDLSYNSLSGTLPDELAFQSMLTSLRLHSNPHIRGTLSPLFRCAAQTRQGTRRLYGCLAMSARSLRQLRAVGCGKDGHVVGCNTHTLA